MTYELFIGDRSYSSWSMRAWLCFAHFDIPFRTIDVDFSGQDVAEQLSKHAPARTVPALKLPEGVVIAESLAIAEELAARHPDLPLWPRSPEARATARWLAAEMAAGFGSLRNECPMNLRTGYRNVVLSDETRADIARIETIWQNALAKFGGPWLCGDYSIADAFYAPVAARLAGYGVDLSGESRDYVDQHLADGQFRRWRAMGLARGATLPWYDLSHDKCPWPGPVPLLAQPVAKGPSENQRCPYSDKPVSDLLEIDGRVFGFCNPFCRDKTLADPEAWPAFMAIYRL